MEAGERPAEEAPAEAPSALTPESPPADQDAALAPAAAGGVGDGKGGRGGKGRGTGKGIHDATLTSAAGASSSSAGEEPKVICDATLTSAAGASSSRAGEVPKAEAPKSEEKCVVCFEGALSHLFVPCGHQCVCATCAATVMERCGKCPICCETAMMTMKVWARGVD